MSALLRLATILLAGTGVLSAQGDLSELFSILRKEGRALSENSRQRTFEILSAYSPGGKSLSGEWPAINEALGDAKPFVRGQACAVLSSLLVFARRIRCIAGPD
jgi:hypothetical protein